MISTKGRYALRVMLDLSEQCDKGFVPMRDVAERQGISLKYLEQIMPALKKAGFVEGVHGKGGGYRLCRKPQEYSVDEILRATEGDLAPVACLSCDSAPCPRRESCKTISMWNKYYELTNEYFEHIKLSDLL